MKIDLLEISNYTSEEIVRAKDFSPAIAHYLTLIEKKTENPRQALRVERHKAWLRSALATVLNKHSAAQICAFWSDATDEIVKKAWLLSGCEVHNIALFALGKWGSRELNLSSDIDVVFVSKDTSDSDEQSSIRNFISCLSEVTSFGFCYRVDTDLKPGGRLSPLLCSTKQFEDYYWSSGETWERLALVRMRPICGVESVTEEVMQTSVKFVFRKFIDFSLLEDLKRLRSQIHSHNPQLDKTKVNLKLAPGGIRDIELFIHALQVIHGGKDTSLRTTSTTNAAQAILNSSRFNAESITFLIETYWRFRELENQVQAMADSQTHYWHSEYGTAQLAEFIELAAHVAAIVEPVLGKPSSILTLPKDPAELATWLESLKYSKVSIEQRIPELISLTAVSTRTFQDEELRLKILRKFIETLSQIALDKDLGIAILIDFFKATRAKTAFFSLLAHEDRLIRELCVLFGCSPYLGGVLASRPELLDSYLYRTQAKPSENFEHQLEQLTERRLLNEIISAIQFLEKKQVSTLCSALSSGADGICNQLLESLKEEYGNSDLQILALGKWGGNELGFRSDLDFIFVTSHQVTDIDQKIARRFISRLTEQHKGGSIYEVDMRLRPSGKGGPLLVTHSALVEYLKTKADPWERQSYLRSRSIAKNDCGGALAINALTSKKLNEKDLDSLSDIRSKLLKNPSECAEIKYSTGGLVDIEFTAQISILKFQTVAPTDSAGMITHLATLHNVWSQHAKELIENYYFLRLIEQLFQLLNQHPTTSLYPNDEAFARVSGILSTAPDLLYGHIKKILARTNDILIDLDPRNRQK